MSACMVADSEFDSSLPDVGKGDEVGVVDGHCSAGCDNDGRIGWSCGCW